MNLINKFYELRGSKFLADCNITKQDLYDSKIVLFSMFSRYGDFFGTLKVIDEFIKIYGDKKLIFVVPPQFKPYIKSLLPNAIAIGVNKRNPIDLINAIAKLKKFKPDLGFNPWSHGSESEYFISFAKKFKFYTNDHRCSPPYTENLYDKPRLYLDVEIPQWRYEKLQLKEHYKTIIICPESSDIEKSLSHENIYKLLNFISVFKPNKIEIAASEKFFKDFKSKNISKLLLGRSKGASLSFLKSMQNADLVITTDSGPMHLSHVLDKPMIAYFSKTTPEGALNSGSKVIIQRTNKLKTLHCEFADHGNCKHATCMDENFNSFLSEYEEPNPIEIKRIDYCAMIQ